jgi:hypothetical protein
VAPRPKPEAPHSRYRKQAEVILSRDKAETMPVPDLPSGREWSKPERQLWQELWTSPPSLAWDDSETLAVSLLVVFRSAVLEGTASAWQATEARHLMDRLGLTPLGRQSIVGAG